jgi:hypothetical protein
VAVLGFPIWGWESRKPAAVQANSIAIPVRITNENSRPCPRRRRERGTYALAGLSYIHAENPEKGKTSVCIREIKWWCLKKGNEYKQKQNELGGESVRYVDVQTRRFWFWFYVVRGCASFENVRSRRVRAGEGVGWGWLVLFDGLRVSRTVRVCDFSILK